MYFFLKKRPKYKYICKKSDLLNSFKAAHPQTQSRLVGFTVLFLAASGVVCASLRETVSLLNTSGFWSVA